MSDVGPPPAKRTRPSNAADTEIYGSNVTVSARQTRYMLRSFKKEQMNENIVLPEPKRKRKPRIEKLMELSADCLLTIFMEMDPKTLSNFADTCDRLRNLAKYHFRLKYSQCFDFESFGNTGRVATDRLEEAEQFLRIFGDQIVTLEMSTAVFIPFLGISNGLLQLIKQYCYHLKSLELREFDITNDSADIIRPLFNCVENLTLFDCLIVDCNPGPMENLKRLVLDGSICELWSDVLWKNFPKLEDVTFIQVAYLSNDSIVQFLKMNPSLKRLSFTECYNITSTIFKAVSKLEYLQEFEYTNGGFNTAHAMQNDLLHLSSLQNLKVLKLDLYNVISPCRLIEKLITNGVAIEHLRLMNGVGDDTIFEKIAQINTLKVLRLTDIDELNENHILSFAKNLKQLETLDIKGRTIFTRYGITEIVRKANRLTHLIIDLPEFILTLPIYLDLLDIIQKREQIIKLELTVFGKNEQIIVPDEVTKGDNEKWISVKKMPSFYIIDDADFI
ncbi:uncharacterized protein LOC129579788 isoform X1 [Sitodiplosis mosellana]|uniref:uncharacterized protein LOC129579788 isoform X1 n=1 Tax=Sitodiplosis mosellana TaxID=263140 RepID=UPI0024445DEA|nr:uncharacterized protein LOC129579788 isoform X1 [Sitodiplosis mosellana]